MLLKLRESVLGNVLLDCLVFENRSTWGTLFDTVMYCHTSGTCFYVILSQLIFWLSSSIAFHWNSNWTWYCLERCSTSKSVQIWIPIRHYISRMQNGCVANECWNRHSCFTASIRPRITSKSRSSLPSHHQWAWPILGASLWIWNMINSNFLMSKSTNESPWFAKLFWYSIH